MATVFLVLFVLIGSLLVAGLIKPAWVLWGQAYAYRFKVLIVFGIPTSLFLILFIACS